MNEQSVSRRRYLAAAGGTLAAAIAAACGSGEQGAPKAAGTQPVQITWWSNLGDQHPESKTRVQIIEEFNATNRPVEVVPEAFGANLTKIKTAIASDTPPDTYFIAWREGAEVFLTGAVADLDAELKGHRDWGEQRKDIFPLMLDTSMWKGKLTSMPIYTNNSLLLWNVEHLQKAGLRPPQTGWTWNDFKDQAKRAGRPPDLWGFELWADSSSFMSWYGTTGGRLLDQTGKKITINSPEAKETAQFMLDLGRQGISPEKRISTGRSQLFIAAGSVFEDTGPYRLANIRDGGIKFDVVSRPVHPTKKVRRAQNGGHNLVVSKIKDTAKLKAGLALAKFMNKGVSQAKICAILGTAIPVNRSALQTKELQEYGKQDPQWKVFADEAPHSDRSPTLPSIVKMLASLDKAINDSMSQKTGVPAALDEAQREMQQLLDADLA
ncbi:MAG: extracellular solute-binding protein [Chloroflexi bacterium]|nr:extracellular solute-binding protein [Chloroflexota bacterium]